MIRRRRSPRVPCRRTPRNREWRRGKRNHEPCRQAGHHRAVREVCRWIGPVRQNRNKCRPDKARPHHWPPCPGKQKGKPPKRGSADGLRMFAKRVPVETVHSVMVITPSVRVLPHMTCLPSNACFLERPPDTAHLRAYSVLPHQDNMAIPAPRDGRSRPKKRQKIQKSQKPGAHMRLAHSIANSQGVKQNRGGSCGPAVQLLFRLFTSLS